MRTWVSRVAAVFGRRDAEAELDDELRSHLEMAAEENRRRGMSDGEARRKAMRDFGGVTQVRESYRMREGLPWIENLRRDVAYGLRQMRKSPGFAAVVIGTLALGIGANTAMFSVVKAVLLAPLPYRDASRIVVVWTTHADQDRPGESRPSSAGDFAIWQQKSGVFEEIAPSWDDEYTLTGAGTPQFLVGYDVAAAYLRILGVAPQIGRLYTDEEDRPGGPPVAVLSDHLWRTTFHSDPGVVGRAITMNGNKYTVVGVMPRGFNYPTGTEVWTPTALAPSASGDFQHGYVRILGRLKPGVTAATAQKALNALEGQVASAHPDTDKGNRVQVVPLREELDGDIRRPLLILLGAAGLVLLIACANTAGLALARDADRQKEIAVRMALGATRVHLLRQFLIENLVLAGLGGAAGLGLAFLGTHGLLAIFPNDVANLQIPKVTRIPIDAGVLMFAMSTTLLTAVLFGLVPVWKATRSEAGGAMKEAARGNTTTRRSNRSRSAMVVTEIALSLMLVSAALLLVRSFQRVMNADLGFAPDHLLYVQVILPSDRYPLKDQQKAAKFVASAVRAMDAVPGVRSAAATNYQPLSGFWGTTNFALRGQAPAKEGQGPEADDLVITPDYLRTLRIPVLRGREFTDADCTGSAPVAMVNETFAKEYFHGRDPVGEELNLGGADKPEWWQIVGVSGDVRAFGQDQPTHAEIYRTFDQHAYPIVAFTLRTSMEPASMVQAAENAMWSVDPELPVYKVIPMDLLATQTLGIRKASSALIAGFALLALVLACIGIYGSMTYAVTQRRQEFGVRMALGAQRGEVMRMVLGSGLRLAAIGIAIGLAGALASSRLLESLLFEVSAMNPEILSGAAAGVAATALLAAFLPARRAASIDPMRTLRAE
jgi:predicted permease